MVRIRRVHWLCLQIAVVSALVAATVTLFLIVFPLMLIFAPVLSPKVVTVVVAMVGVGVTAAMWLVGIVALVCCGQEIGVGTRSG